MMVPADKHGRESKGGKDPEVLAERRARRAELAEGELRARLADAEQRVAQLEHGAHEATRLRDRLAERAERDGRMAALVADAATTLRAAREALDREIAARGVLEAALHAERSAREAAEQAVVAERAARDAATSALTAERARVVPTSVWAPPAVTPPAPVTQPAAAAPAAPAPEAPDNEQLIAGLALAAERLREQVPVVDEPPAAQPAEPSQPVEAPAPAESPALEEPAAPPAQPVDAAPAAPAAKPVRDPEFAPPAAEVGPAADPPATPSDEPWAPRPGGLVERIGRALRRRG